MRLARLDYTDVMYKSIACTATVLLGVLATATAHGEERRIATIAPRGSTWMKLMERGAAAVEKATEGRITTKFYAGGVQGDELAVVRKMRLGTLDGAALTSVGLSAIDQSIRVLQLPMMFQDLAEMDWVRKRMWPYFRKKFAAKGYILGEPGDLGWVYLMSTFPIRTMSDLRSAKLWIWSDNPVGAYLVEKHDLEGVPLSIAEVYPGLQSGRINACHGSLLGAVALQWSSRIKYINSQPTLYGIGSMVVRKEIWDKTSAADRKAQIRITRKLSRKLRRVVRAENETAKKAMLRKGVQMIDSTAETNQQMAQLAHQLWDELAGKYYSKEELAMVLEWRAKYRARKAKK